MRKVGRFKTRAGCRGWTPMLNDYYFAGMILLSATIGMLIAILWYVYKESEEDDGNT